LRKALKDRVFFQDKPEEADIYHMRVREGDLLILATDGLFDNLF
jgi:serine/threonine protein phosphatase PrpC